MDKIVSSITALGIPGIVLMVAINATGYAGAAGITAALAALGPGGMVGGIATLGAVGLISKALSEFGFDAIFSAVIKELVKRGETVESLKEKIDSYPISKPLKRKLREELDRLDDSKE